LKAIIITGRKNSGKTNLIEDLLAELKFRNKNVSGILSQAYVRKGKKVKYYVCDIQTGLKKLLCSEENTGSAVQLGNFGFYIEGINFGLEALSNKSDFIFIDEIGRLELQGQGWSSALDNFINENNSIFLIGVRKDIVEKIIKKWDIHIIDFIDLDLDSKIDIEMILDKIHEYEK